MIALCDCSMLADKHAGDSLGAEMGFRKEIRVAGEKEMRREHVGGRRAQR